VFIWQVEAKNPVRLKIGELSNASFPIRWSPDSSRLLFSDGNSATAKLEVDVLGGDYVDSLSTVASVDADAGYDWDATGSQIAFVDTNKNLAIAVLNARRTYEVTKSVDLGYGAFRDLRWSNSGIMMAVRNITDEYYRLRIFDATLVPVTVCPEMDGDLISPIDTGKGVMIATLRKDASDRIVLVEDCHASIVGEYKRIISINSLDGQEYDILATRMSGPPSLDTFIPASGLHPIYKNVDRSSSPSQQRINTGSTLVPAWVWDERAITQTPRGIVIWLHGGPHLMESGEWTPLSEEIVRQGFVLIVPNYSGSSGYGANFERRSKISQQSAELQGVVEWAKQHWPALADHVVIGGSSYGTRIILEAVRENPGICRKIVLTSTLMRSDEPLVPFNGNVIIFHGESDQIAPIIPTLWALWRAIKLENTEDSHMIWSVVRQEGHGLGSLRSQLEIADAATTPNGRY